MKKSYDHEYISWLVEKSLDGDSNAFAELYGLTYNHVYNYACHYLKDTYLAQDAVQEIYITALKNLSSLQVSSLFVAWLNQISFHTCYQFQQKVRASDTCDNSEDILNSIISSDLDIAPEFHILRKDIHNSLEQALEKLPEMQHQVILLKYYKDMKLYEIANTLEISQSTVKRYLTDAKKFLKTCLQNSWSEGCDYSETIY